MVNKKNLSKINYPSAFNDLTYEGTIYAIIDAVNTTIGDVNVSIDDMEAFKVQMEANYNTFTTNINQIVTDFKASTNAEITRFEGVVNTSITGMQTDITTFKTTINGQITDMQTEIANFKTAITKQINDFETLINGKVTDLTNQFNELKTWVQNYLTSPEFTTLVTNKITEIMNTPEFAAKIQESIQQAGIASTTNVGMVKGDGVITVGATGTMGIQANGVVSNMLAPMSVENAKIAPLSIEGAGGTAGALESRIKAGTIGTEDLKDYTVTGIKIAENSIGSGKLINGAVTGIKIANNAVTGQKIDSLTINTNNLALNSVTNDTIADKTITYQKIAEKTIIGSMSNIGGMPEPLSRIYPNSIGTDDLARNAVGTLNIANNAITHAKINNASGDSPYFFFKNASNIVVSEYGNNVVILNAQLVFNYMFGMRFSFTINIKGNPSTPINQDMTFQIPAPFLTYIDGSTFAKPISFKGNGLIYDGMPPATQTVVPLTTNYYPNSEELNVAWNKLDVETATKPIIIQGEIQIYQYFTDLN